MKKSIILFLSVFVSYISAQTSKTLNVTVPGTLSTILTTTEKNSIQNLTITGNVDARDIKCLRDEISRLSTLDISNVTIKAYSGNFGTKTTNTILPVYGDYLANEIPINSFYVFGNSNTTLTTVKLPQSITNINSSAFGACVNLKSINIPPNTIRIGAGAFANCPRLLSITLPASLSSIESGAFGGCTLLGGTIILPPLVTEIYDDIFLNCISISNVIFQGQVAHIGNNSFNGCTSLVDFTIPNTVISIGDNAFADCTSLTTISIPSSVKKIGVSAFKHCKNVKNIFLPQSVSISIGNYAFALRWLTNEPLINDVIIKSQTYNAQNIQLGTSVFDMSGILYVPKGSVNIYKALSQWNSFKILEETTATNDITSSNIKIYPNPVIESFKIEGIDGIVSMKLIDITGKIVFSKLINNNETISLRDFAKGEYIVQLAIEDVYLQKKILKE